MRLASEESLRKFFDNFTEQHSGLISDHVKQREKDRVTEEEIDFLKNAGFSGRNITSIVKQITSTAFMVIKILYENKDSINYLLTPLAKGGPGFLPQNISSILSGAKEKVGDALRQLSSPQNRNNLIALLTPTDQTVVINGQHLKGLGFVPHNLSSIFHSLGNKVGGDLEKLVLPQNWNKMVVLLTPLGEVANIDGRQIKGLGLTSHNLSSMFHTDRTVGANIEKKLEKLFNDKLPKNISEQSDFDIDKFIEVLSSGNTSDEISLTGAMPLPNTQNQESRHGDKPDLTFSDFFASLENQNQGESSKGINKRSASPSLSPFSGKALKGSNQDRDNKRR